jgi:hypothetical protein
MLMLKDALGFSHAVSGRTKPLMREYIRSQQGRKEMKKIKDKMTELFDTCEKVCLHRNNRR